MLGTFPAWWSSLMSVSRQKHWHRPRISFKNTVLLVVCCEVFCWKHLADPLRPIMQSIFFTEETTVGSQIMLYSSPKLILESEDQLAVKTPRKINRITSNNLSTGQSNGEVVSHCSTFHWKFILSFFRFHQVENHRNVFLHVEKQLWFSKIIQILNQKHLWDSMRDLIMIINKR